MDTEIVCGEDFCHPLFVLATQEPGPITPGGSMSNGEKGMTDSSLTFFI